MKLLKYTFLAIISAGLFSAFAADAVAQNNEQRRAAVQAFNEARELAQNQQYEQSIEKFKEAISEGESLGEGGADIVRLSKKQLPNIYYEKALNSYRTFQSSQTISNLNATITAFEEAANAADQYGNSKVAQQSRSNMTKLTYAKSRLQYSQQNYEAALETIEQVIADNPNYATAYYHKGLILKKQEGNFDAALATFDKAIEIAEKNGDTQVASNARENASGELVYRGAKQTESQNYATAIEYLNRALEYNPESADAHYRLAQAYNDRGSFDQGLQHAQKALELENGGRTAKAKIYFELASAYKGKGDFSQACDAFADAAYGPFKSSAEHQMEFELNCDSQ